MLIRNEDKNNPVKKLNIVVSLAHLALQGVENFSLLYQRLNDFVLGNIGVAVAGVHGA